MSRGPVHRAIAALRLLRRTLPQLHSLAYRRRILVAGLPKTGTTAVFFALARVLPLAKARFEPPDLAAALHEGHRPFYLKHLLRLHEPDDLLAVLDSFDRRVLLVRDPRDRLVSGQLYHLFHARFLDEPGKREALLALLEAKERAPAALPFGQLCREIHALGGTDFFTHLHGTAAQFDAFLERAGAQFHQLRYEDFVAGRLEALNAYLGLRLRNDPVAVEKPARRVLRTGLAGDWRNWFTAEDVAEMRPKLQPFLARLGYGDDWQLNRPERLEPAHGSDYVRRLLHERDREPVTARGPRPRE